MDKIKIAVQKAGRLNEDSLQLLKECGISIDNGKDQLKASASNFPLEVLYLRNGDIPQYLRDGVVDVAIIGENATKIMTTGGGSSELKANYEISPLEGLQKRFKNETLNYAKGYSSEDIKPIEVEALTKEALETASNADMVLFVGGLNKGMEPTRRLKDEIPKQSWSEIFSTLA